MKRTIVVVNGERDWHTRFPGAEVVYGRIQDCAWVLRDGELWYVDREAATRVGGVLWRVGAIRPSERYRTALEIIRLSGVPCVNPAGALLRGFDRLSMLAELRTAGLPVVPFDVAVGDDMARRLGRTFPLVVKAGNHHAGLGKMRVCDQESWGDVADLLFAVDDYVTVEPYIAYRRDVRCLAIGERYWAMEREGRGWKANVDTRKYRLIEPPSRSSSTRAPRCDTCTPTRWLWTSSSRRTDSLSCWRATTRQDCRASRTRYAQSSPTVWRDSSVEPAADVHGSAGTTTSARGSVRAKGGRSSSMVASGRRTLKDGKSPRPRRRRGR
ncbi:hypothetical protein OV079_31970 [Nannocystis pusilla]|uniref:Synapsin ATP-binding domain-containing protein n=1 Tax=Nannocystis pusilla TaxID=889268 RepID=A0A9X3EVD1_9BACT|nr:hypothetical protein [Nannocystis pusilla]MCY1010104.1 hypothetical protein [Nannocystis pusilla]